MGEGVVVVVVHDGEALLVSGRALAEIAVPGPAPAGIVGVEELVGPGGGPGAGIVADGGRAPAVDVGIGLEIAGPGLEPHDAVVERADRLPLAIAGLHDEDRVA